jgi:hypothetical protein
MLNLYPSAEFLQLTEEVEQRWAGRFREVRLRRSELVTLNIVIDLGVQRIPQSITRTIKSHFGSKCIARGQSASNGRERTPFQRIALARRLKFRVENSRYGSFSSQGR